MSQLARRWSQLVLADVSFDEMPTTRAARESGSLLRPPATEADIAAVEERLGRRLPPSYREFLLVSDGAFGDLYGRSIAFSEDGWEVARGDSPVVGVGFLPVADLRWLRESDPGSAEIYRVAGPSPEPVPATVDGSELYSWTAFADGLKIAVDQHPGLTCLVPFDGMEEWQVWNIHFETCVGFLSFRSMLEGHVALREPITSIDEFEDVLQRASAGDLRAVRRLFHTIAPEAAPRLIELLEDGQLGGAAVAALGRIATTEAVEALVRLEPNRAGDGLATAGTERARDVLAQRGDYYRLSVLGDPRGAQLAAERLSNRSPSDGFWSLSPALRALARSRDPRFIPLVMPLLSEEPQLSLSAAGTLAWLGAPEGPARIATLAETENPARTIAQHKLRVLNDGHLP